MAVLRVNKTKDYTVMSNYHFKEKEMTLKAKGLLSQMLSLPDSWDYSIAGLVAINKENESSIKSTLNELKKFGYLKVTKLMPNETKTGRIEYLYDIYEKPYPIQEAEKQETEKQELENQPLENQPLENQRQYNNITKELNTNELTTNELIIKENIPYQEIVSHLNSMAGTNYRASSKKTRELIRARINEGYTLQDFQLVIDKKVREWINDNKMKGYIRPETLFGTKFEGYLNQPVKELTTKDLTPYTDFSDFYTE